MRWTATLCVLLACLAPQALAAQAGAIRGRVTDAVGAPVPGASVSVNGTRFGATTGADGSFAIPGVAPGTYQLRGSRIGYGEQSQTVRVGPGQSVTANFELRAQAVQLEGLVAVGYGTQRRRDVTGSVASIDVAETQAAPVVAVDQVLQGRAPGVQVTQANGAPGGGASVRIRGTNSISANSEPLYVIDGIPALIGSDARGSGRTGLPTNPLADMNPSDIESIQVLKDASATAVYGARGANGVVLITTRRGRRGESSVQFQSSYGSQEITRMLPMMNAREYADVANEARANVRLGPLYSAAEIAAFGEGTDWQKEIFRSAPVQNHAMTISGGDERTRYMISAGLFDQEGIVINSAFRRYSARLNLDREVTDRFRIGNSLTMSRTVANQAITDNGIGPNSGVVQGALEFVPTLPVRGDDGGYVMFSGVEPTPNPVATAMEITNDRTASRVLGSLFGEYDLSDALRLRVSVGGNVLAARDNYYAPSSVAQGLETNGDASVTSAQSFEALNENILTYRRSLRDGHDLDLTAGFTAQRFRSDFVTGRAQQFATDVTGERNLSAGALPLAPASGVNEWGLLSWLGRANYNLLNRYLFTVTGRADGSSKFGTNNKWGFFPSAAVGWRLSEEPFLRDAGLFDDLKLRLSYGLTGNQEIGTYASLAQLNTTFYAFGNQQVVGYVRGGRAPNPDLRWESTRQLDLGVDASFLDNRISITADYYRSLTNDLLLTVPLTATTGYNSQLQNVGSVKNRGVELGISTVNVERDNFSWKSSLNLARNRNEVSDLGDVEYLFPTGSRFGGTAEGGVASIVQVGRPLGTFYGFRTQGIWQQGEDLKSVQDQFAAPGEWKYVDVNGDGIINLADRTFLGDPQADLFGGLTNTFTLGAFTLDVFLQGSYGNEVANASYLRINSGLGSSNLTTAYLDRWSPQNPDARWPRANLQRPRRMLDRFVEDASFLRLQSVSVGYRIPDGLLPGADRARVYASGQNLHVWTRYSGYDPEVSSYGGDPTLRGFDLGTYPRSRAIHAGIDLTF